MAVDAVIAGEHALDVAVEDHIEAASGDVLADDALSLGEDLLAERVRERLELRVRDLDYLGHVTELAHLLGIRKVIWLPGIAGRDITEVLAMSVVEGTVVVDPGICDPGIVESPGSPV